MPQLRRSADSCGERPVPASGRSPHQHPEGPQSASLHPVVAFRVGDTRLAIDLAVVERVLPMVAVTAIPGAPPMVIGAIRLEGGVVPVLDPRRRLALATREPGLYDHMLVVQTPRRLVAMLADEALGVIHVNSGAIVPAAALDPRLEWVKGITALPDGLLFIYDVETFLTAAEDEALEQAMDGGMR